MSALKAFGLIIVSVCTLPNPSVTVNSRVEVADDARTLNIWCVFMVLKLEVSSPLVYVRGMSYEIV